MRSPGSKPEPGRPMVARLRGERKDPPHMPPRVPEQERRGLRFLQRHEPRDAIRRLRMRSQNRRNRNTPPRHEDILPEPPLIAFELAESQGETFGIACERRAAKVGVEFARPGQREFNRLERVGTCDSGNCQPCALIRRKSPAIIIASGIVSRN